MDKEKGTEKKTTLAISLTPTGQEMLTKLSEYKGLSRSSTIELYIRDAFRIEGLSIQKGE